MIVYHIDRQRGWTGQTNRTLNVVKGLTASGWSAGLIAHRGGALAERAETVGVEVHEFPLYGTAMYASIAPVVKLLRSKRVDVLHCHGARDHLLAALVKQAGGVRHLVRTRHNHIPLNSGAFSRLLFRPCSAVVTVSDFVQRVAIEDRIDKHKLRTIHSAVDVERYRPGPRSPKLASELGIRPGEMVVGHVSTLVDRKGVDVLLRAVERVRRGAGDPLRCVIVGGDYERWAALADQIGVADGVTFTGVRTDVPAVLRHFDVFVMVSSEEALGTAAIEAMSTGIAVIGSTAGGMPESITPDCGLTVPPHDVDALTGAIRVLLDDPDRRRALAAAGRQRAVDQFSTTVLVENTKRLYEDLLSGAMPRR